MDQARLDEIEKWIGRAQAKPQLPGENQPTAMAKELFAEVKRLKTLNARLVRSAERLRKVEVTPNDADHWTEYDSAVMQMDLAADAVRHDVEAFEQHMTRQGWIEALTYAQHHLSWLQMQALAHSIEHGAPIPKR